MKVHLINPIVVPQRRCDHNLCWITKKVAKFLNRDVFLFTGNAEIQISQGARFRLQVTNIGLRAGTDTLKSNQFGNEPDRCFIYLLSDISNKSMNELARSPYNVRLKSSIDLRNLMEQKANSTLDIPLQRQINGIAISDFLGFAFISPKTVSYPERVHAYGEFVSKVPDVFHDLSGKRGACSKSSSR